MAGIKISDLRVVFTIKDTKLRVIDGLNLALDQDKITVILGKSGCGKTTLLRTIIGLEKTYEGMIDIDNLKLAYVFQEPRLMPWLNVYQNITFGIKDYQQEDIDRLIALVGLEGFKQAHINQLSGGMQSRVSIARALAHHADFMLMDEPFSALDYFTRLNIQKELLNIYHHNKLGILFVTHNIDEALILGHKIIVMGKGNIISEYELNDQNRDLLDEKYIKLKKQIIHDIGGKNEENY